MREFALPGTRARYAPDRVCSARHYRLELDVDVARRRIAGTAIVRLVALVAGDRWLRLDAAELHIDAVRRSNKPVAFRSDGAHLDVELKGLAIGDDVELLIEYAATPRRGLYFVGPDEGYPGKPVQVWSQGQDEDSRFWFPCLDVPSEKATSELIVTVPADFFALSNGIQVSDKTADGRRTQHWRMDTPHSCYLITLAAGRLVAQADSAGTVELAYYCAPGREADCKRTLARTPQMIELFARLFGVPYPYPRYAQVFVADFIFGGMENTSATTLTDVVMYDERAALDFDADSLIAHELAHQWFGDLLTCRTWGEGWLNEGFATYAEYLWREAAGGRDEADLELEEWAEAYFGEDRGRYRRVVATNVYDAPIDIFDHHLYEKGGRVLHMLRQELGDDGFWRAIRHYLEKHRTGSVETRDLARAVSDATGRNVDWFFDQWVTRGAGHPELDVGVAWDPEKKLVALTVRQTQTVNATTPLFRLPIVLELGWKSRTARFEFAATEPQHTFLVPVDDEPLRAVVDPGKTLLAAVKADKPVAMWLAELAAARHAIDRRDAARQLGRLGGGKATAALVATLREDDFWGVRAACAEALAGMRTVAAREALIVALGREPHRKARRAIVRALGEFRGDETAAAALVPIVVHGDASYFVEAEACLALGKTRSPRAFDLLAGAAERESFTDVVRQFAYRGLAELRDDRAAPLLEQGTRYGRPSHGRRAALGALADLTRGRRDRACRDCRERAEELLRDPDFRVQAAAIEALGQLGDPAASGALDDVATRDPDGRLRRRAREIVRDLGDARAQGEQLTALRDDLERVKGDAAKLRERVDTLEAVGAPPAKKPPRAPSPRARAAKPAGRQVPRRPARRG